MYISKCKYCGREFPTDIKAKKYCTEKCRREAAYRRQRNNTAGGILHLSNSHREFTPDSSMLIVEYMDEDGFNVEKIAQILGRETEDVREHVQYLIESGMYERIRYYLFKASSIYRYKVIKRRRFVNLSNNYNDSNCTKVSDYILNSSKGAL